MSHYVRVVHVSGQKSIGRTARIPNINSDITPLKLRSFQVELDAARWRILSREIVVTISGHDATLYYKRL